MRGKASLLLALMTITAGLMTAPTAGATASAETLEGVIRLLAADPVPAGDQAPGTAPTEDSRLVLVVGDISYVLTGEQGEPNTRVRATGIRTNQTFNATSIQQLGPAGDAVPPAGTTHVLVMLAHWNVPDSVTPAIAAANMFTDANGWYRDASYGVLGQTGDVTPWMEIDGPVGGKCFADHVNTMTQAKTAATALGYDLADYDNYVMYAPYNGWQEGSDCDGYAGWAYVGAPNTWLNGYIDRRVLVHEQGHNYGLGHSHSYLCTQVITGTCTWSDYGDDFDAMGASGLVGHFSASQKDKLDWMDGRIVDLTSGGQATLAPMAKDALEINSAVVHVSPTRSYWLEFRQKIDYDSGLPVAATNGVLIHAQDPAISGDDSSNLLDTRPHDGLHPNTATLRPGRLWHTPEGFTIAVGRVTPDGAIVTVRAPVCPDADFEPDDTVAQARLVSVPSTETHAFCESGDVDRVQFVAQAGERLRLETLNLGPRTDTVLKLYASDGTTLIAKNDDFKGGPASRITFTTEADGTYFLLVRQFYDDFGTDVTYDLKIAHP